MKHNPKGVLGGVMAQRAYDREKLEVFATTGNILHERGDEGHEGRLVPQAAESFGRCARMFSTM